MYSEKAIQNFYDWEVKGRGYYLYPYNVSLEPPYKPFFHSIATHESYTDDGKAPTFFERIFKNKKPVETEEEIKEEALPEEYYSTSLLKQINISYPKSCDFKDKLFQEFLNMLSETNEQVSFEIIAQGEESHTQIICSELDERRILNLLNTYFQGIYIKSQKLDGLPFEYPQDILLLDFGYDEEFIRPINSANGLTSLMATMNNLRDDEAVMFQVIFKGVNYPWANSIIQSVNIGGEAFFEDAPEMLTCAKEKVSSPLFSVILRLAVEASHPEKAESLAYELIQNIRSSSRSKYNSLIPLSNDGYAFEDHSDNLRWRTSNRHGMLMNANELSSFVYFPETKRSNEIERKTKAVPTSLINQQYFLGLNTHNGTTRKVSLNDADRLRHTHIIGATGTGKSTLITNLFLEDVHAGNGCCIFDPHGDTVGDIITRIPPNRLKDVILIDPSDYEYSFCINLLNAKTEIERIVLSSDLVEAFKRHSTSWGDQMTSVLSNAVNTFLESTKGGTLIDLRKFLLDNTFRKDFLKTVNDSHIHYYWNHEYLLLKKGSISPLLTRLDTFLRPKLIRNMLSSKDGLDFNEVLNQRKILLVKLSQGLIGEENSYLLGTLILSKVYQVAQARQALPKDQRLPFYIYLDEFQNFITPSITGILSGARKYSLGLNLAHQNLNQIKDEDVYSSLLSNANIRVCFRVSDADSKKLESSFSFFDSKDLQNLNIGEAISKVGRSTEDFSLETVLLQKVSTNTNSEIITKISREKYSRKVSDVVEEVIPETVPEPLPQIVEVPKPVKEEKSIPPEPKEEILPKAEVRPKEEIQIIQPAPKPISNIEEKGKEYLNTLAEKEEIREHRFIQTFIKKLSEQRGYVASIEEEVKGGRVDVSLLKDNIKIACEIAHHNSADYEVRNIQKCLSAGYNYVCVLSKDEKHLQRIQGKSKDIPNTDNVRWFKVEQFALFLDSLEAKAEAPVQKVRGYRVRVNYGSKIA
ncbi:type IV secretory system conjugative DNA transfer family protein [Niabella aquatica]